METVWNVKKIDRDLVDMLAFERGIPKSAAAVFVARNLHEAEEFEAFTKIGWSCLHDPWLLPDIHPVVDRLNYAIDNDQKIFCWGDYDVDGVTSTAVIVRALRAMKARLEYHVPHRINDGYDIKVPSIQKALDAGADLMISVDCGIVAFEAANKAKEAGLDLIITDHHTPSADGRIPDCIGVVNPNRKDSQYPFPSLAGVGIAFKVMMALANSRGMKIKELAHELLEYVALGTVADVAPMIDENRTLVHMGCNILTQSSKPGIKELLKVAGVKSVNTTAIGFQLGPRINAIGRLGDSATALDLMLATTDGRAKLLAHQLDEANRRRQAQQEDVIAEAEALTLEQHDMSTTKIIVVGAKSWHPGLIGLVAGKLAEKYSRPALVCSINNEGMAKGSCRSTRSFNILEALKSEHAWAQFKRRDDGSVVCGGHAFAAGFELPAANLGNLRKHLNEYAEQKGLAFDEKVLDIDANMFSGDLTLKTYNAIAKLAPFGADNPEPLFLTKGMRVMYVKGVGADDKHLKMRLKGPYENSPQVQAIGWRLGEHMSSLIPEETIVDVVYKLSLEEFRGQTNLTMILEDIKIIS